ncbi:MFS domain-containing protein [Trichostrongylus colubriformis]|uniref:MFS domain-containing protein n=1 Tax=Trichostrongylus colubriformis TaxID=6319 RepID=A0AAN8ICE7_TRICO
MDDAEAGSRPTVAFSTAPPEERTRSPSTAYLHLDADKILSAYGKFGRYQMITYLITNSVHVLFAINMMVMPFITEDPKFECQITPPDGVHWEYTVVDKCTVMDSNNWTLACDRIPGARYYYNDTNHESLASEFNLVCDNYESVEHGSSVFMLGGMLVAPIITQLSDLFGRRLTFLIPLYVAVVSNLICAVAPNYMIFLIFRFIAGVATTGFSVIGWVLCMESVALEFRSLIPLMGTITWVIGYLAAGVLRLFISNWRWLYFAVSVPGLLTIPYYWLTPESIHWLITNKKNKGVSKYIRTSSRFNRVEIPLHECKSTNDLTTEVKKRTFFDMFKNPGLVVHLIMNAYILIVMNGTYWALSLFSTELSEDKMTGFFLSGIVEIPAGLIAIALLVYLDRKTVSVLSLTLQAVSMMCALYLPVGPQITMIFPLLAKVFNSIVWCSQPLLYTESTPTAVRNVFCGAVGFLGDLGSVLAPYLKRLEAIHKSAPTLLIAVMSISSAVLVLTMSETKDRKLPEDIDDFEPGPLLHWMKKKKKDTKMEESSPMITLDPSRSDSITQKPSLET